MSLLAALGWKSAKPIKRRTTVCRKRLWHEPLEKRDMLTLLGIDPAFPVTTYNSTGHLQYDPVAHNTFDLTATPIGFKASAISDPTTVDPPASLCLHILVDNAGNLISGVPGDDLIVTGVIDDGTIMESGVLLTGEITQFGFAESGATDVYDFRFTATGGALLSLFAGQDIGVTTTSEFSTFTGSFDSEFEGGAKGNVGTIDPLPPDGGGTISGHKFRDMTGNGITSDDVPLGGITIQLFRDANGNGKFDHGKDELVASTTTADGTGAYSFTDLAPGTYFVKEVLPKGSKQTAPDTKVFTVTVTEGSNTPDLDFANKLKKSCDPHPCKQNDPCEKRNPCNSDKGDNDNQGHDNQGRCDNNQSRWNARDCKPGDPRAVSETSGRVPSA